ncbi:MAG: penicillin acylase family protein [Caldilineaceae bacterium]
MRTRCCCLAYEILLLTLLLAITPSAVHAQGEYGLNIVTYTLDNGLEVILVKDDSAPTVAVDLWYDVGGANDPQKRSGFAHLFEHLLFQGSDNVAPGEHFRLIAAAGGDANATTGIDRTNYFEVLPSHQLPLALWLEAERMRSLDITQENFEREREVVKEEYRLRIENQPYGKAQLLWQTLPFNYPPYENPVIGSLEDLDAATLEDVLAFRNAYYNPNNATLTVAGDIDIAQTQALIEQYFGDIPTGKAPPTLPEYEFTVQQDAQVITVTDALAQVPATFIAYRIPPRADPDYYALEVLARILGTGNSSRLAQALVDTGQAAAANTFTQGNVGPSLFSAILVPNPGVDPQTLVAVYEAELARLREGDVSAAEITKAVNQIRVETLNSLESVLSVAESVQAANFYLGDPDLVLTELERYAAVTPADIQRVAEQYLQPESRNVIKVVTAQAEAAAPNAVAPNSRAPIAPQPISPLAQPLTPAMTVTETLVPTVTVTVTATALVTATRAITDEEASALATPIPTATIRSPLPTPANAVTQTVTTDERTTPPPPLPVQALNLPAINQSELANGLEVISVPQHQLPIFTAVLVLPGGESAAPAAQTGVATLTADLLTRGTETRSAQEIASTIEEAGGQLVATANQDTTHVMVSGLSENFTDSLTLLGDVVLNPIFPSAELAVARQQTLTGLQVALSTPGVVAQRALSAILYGDHPYGESATLEEVAAITRTDLIDYYEAQFHPTDAILVVIGDVTHEEAVAQAEEIFGEWPAADTTAAVEYPEPPTRSETTIYLIDRPGSTQATVALGHLLTDTLSQDRYAVAVANQILGAGPSSRLFQKLREERGYTYGIYSNVATPRDQGALTIQASVRNEVVAPALTAILDELTTLRTTQVPTTELESAKAYLIGNYALQTETAAAVAARLLDLKLRGLPLRDLEEYPEAIDAVSGTELRQAAQRYLHPNEVAIVVVGDAEQIEDELATVAPVVHITDPAASAADEILWDTWGVPHIFAQEPASAFYGLGWAQTHSRGELLLRLYAQARGQAAEFYGEDYRQSDQTTRLLGIPTLGEAWYQQQPADFQHNLDAFARGINDYAAQHPDQLSAEAQAVLPVSGADVVAHVTRVLAMFVSAPSGCGEVLPGLGLNEEPPASNGWALGPSYTTSANAMLLANPHLAWFGAQTFYEAHLNLPTANIYGATLVGFPVLAIAFNDHLGWTHTVNTLDGCDTYLITAAGATPDAGYLLDGTVHAYDVVTQTLTIKGADGQLTTEPFVIRRTVHGPVTEINGQTIAVRMAMLEQAPVPGLAQEWWDMANAQNLDEFEHILARLQLPMFTVLYADAEGQIMALFNGIVPVRPRGDAAFWQQPVPGDESDLIWAEVHDYAALPKVVNPARGWVQNSNSAPWYMTQPFLDPAEFPAYMAPHAINTRELRGLQLLTDHAQMSMADVIEAKYSTYSLVAEEVLDDLVAAARASADESVQATAPVLATWDRTFAADSRGGLLFTLWFQNWVQQTLGQWMAANPGQSITIATLVSDLFYATPWDPQAPLTTPRGLADPELATAALRTAVEQLQQQGVALGTPWGEVARLRHNGYDFSGNGNDGSLGVFRVIGYLPAPDGRLQSYFGDTFIAVVEFSDPVQAQVLMTYGNAANPTATGVGAQLALSAAKQLRPALLTRTAIEANLVLREALDWSPATP